MLELTIPRTDLWDERNQRFIPVKEQKLRLEHSLVSLSKWESRWCKVFLSKEQKTIEESFGEYLVKLDETVKKTDVFGKAVSTVVDIVKIRIISIWVRSTFTHHAKCLVPYIFMICEDLIFLLI